MLGDCIRLVLKPGNEKFSILYECAFELEQHLQVYTVSVLFHCHVCLHSNAWSDPCWLVLKHG